MKKIIVFPITVLMLFCSVMCAFATEASEPVTEFVPVGDSTFNPFESDDWQYYRDNRLIPQKQLAPLLCDNDNLLSADEKAEVSALLEKISEELKMSVVIVTEYSLSGSSAQDYADDFYDYNGYGCGDNRDGILLLVSLEERDYHISTCGYGITAFTDYGLGVIEDEFLGYLSDGDYCEAFESFANEVEILGMSARSGSIVDTNNKKPAGNVKKGINVKSLIICALIGTGLSCLIVFIIAKSSTKSVAFASGAQSYRQGEGLTLTEKKDHFIYKNVTKRYNPPAQTSSSGGGSSTHTSSSGSSHGGHGGKF